MDLTVSLNGSKRRDIRLHYGDTETINVVVYADDADTGAPALTVTDVNMTAQGDYYTIPTGVPFTVADDYGHRSWYSIKGTIAGAVQTLAYGHLDIIGGPQYPSGTDYGFPYGTRWL